VTDARGGTDRRGTATSLPRVWASHTRGSHVRESRVCYKRIRPGLATVLVGDDPASVGYVRKKHETCATAGFYSENIHLDQAITQSQLRTEIQRLDTSPKIHGVLIQHPLPPQLDLGAALLDLDPKKDADGLHPTNVGRLALGLLVPCPAPPQGSKPCSVITESRRRVGT
jgi:methylenetetrahydrofolate dehydrogenase (NADP+)/methenyltetrahydrofolate cyclohydrolase